MEGSEAFVLCSRLPECRSNTGSLATRRTRSRATCAHKTVGFGGETNSRAMAEERRPPEHAGFSRLEMATDELGSDHTLILLDTSIASDTPLEPGAIRPIVGDSSSG